MSRRLAERYEIGAEIGAGGSARVHEAHDERLGRRVAVKLLDAGVASSADPKGRERFLRECRTSAGFTHRHAVTVFDAGEDDGELYLVMELVDGPSLAHHLARSGPLAIDDAVRIAKQILDVLGAAHRTGLVHRDVKPANVLLDPDGDVKLADFGIAKRFDELDAAITATDIVMGTPHYLAPEQARGEPATPATDLFATGVVLFEMLAGRRPFDGGTFVQTAMAAASAPAPPLSEIRDDVGPELAAVVSRALATDPSERYASADEMARDLVAAPSGIRSTAGTTGSAGPRTAGDTSVYPIPPEPVTELLAHDPGSEHSADRSARRTAIVLLAALAVLAGTVGAAVALGRDDRPIDEVLVDEDSRATATDAPAPEPAPEPEPAREPVDEIIPGFPATDDLGEFAELLARDPDSVGESGEELLDDVEEVLGARGAEQHDLVRTLREELVEWVDDDEIHPAIAAALDELLVELVPPGRR